MNSPGVAGNFGLVVDGMYLPFASTLREEDADRFFSMLLKETAAAPDLPGREYVTALVMGSRRTTYRVTVDEDGRARMRLIEQFAPLVPPMSPDRKLLLDGLAEIIARDLLRKHGFPLEDGRMYGGKRA